jgi:TRAP-type uncharacterized transport system fused permease subunit
MAVTFNGFLFKSITVVERLIFLIVGIALIYPNWMANVAGLVVGGIMAVTQLVLVKRQAHMAAIE